MRKILWVVVILVAAKASWAQDFRFGLAASPLLSWMKPIDEGISSTGVRFGFNYGLILDYNIADNYGIGSGLSITHNGGKLKHDSVIVFLNDTFPVNAEVEYITQYIEIPLTLKFRTNEIGYITYFMQFGVTPGINIRSKGNVKTNTDKGLVGKDIGDEVKAFNLALTIGGGIHYSLSGNTALVTGLFFNNGFVDVTADADKKKAILNYLSLKIGVIF